MADCYAMSHAQDYIGIGIAAHLQVAFNYSAGTNALAVYGSAILDPEPFLFRGRSPHGAGCLRLGISSGNKHFFR